MPTRSPPKLQLETGKADIALGLGTPQPPYPVDRREPELLLETTLVSPGAVC